jgi:hypothetical protein
VYFTGDSYIPANVVGTTSIYGTIFAGTGATYTIGEALVFSLSNVPASTEGYGMQLFNSGGSLVFDAANDHLMIKGFSSISFTGTDTESVNESPDIFTGSQPAVLVPNYYQSTAARRGTTGFSSWVRNYEGGLRRQGTTIYAKRILTEANLEDAILNWSYSYGSNVNTIFGIDAANLGAGGGTGGGTALAAYIQPSGTEVTSCSYDSNSTSTCTITQSYFVTPTGGNGNAISYSWSIVNPSIAGLYSISGSSTGSSVTVVTTSGDTAGAITATLQCIVSQSGSVSTTATYTLSRVHEGFGEFVSISPSTVGWNNNFTLTVKGVPGTTFTYQVTTTSSQPSTFINGPLTLDQSGNYVNTGFTGSTLGSPAGLRYLWVKFAATNNVKSASVTTTGIGPTINYFRVKAPGGSYSTSVTGGYATTPYFEWSTTDATSVSVTDLSNTSLTAVDIIGPTRYTSRTYTLTATHVSGGTTTASVTYNVTAPTITVSPTTLPNTKVNNSYNQTVSASGGRASYTFSISSGALPSGLSISSGGSISGTPTTQGTYNFTVQATDADGYTGSRSYSVAVDPENIIPTISQFQISLFSPESYSSSVSGGFGTSPKFRWTVSNASSISISTTSTVSGNNPYTNTSLTATGVPALGSINSYGTTTITLTATSGTNDTASATVYFIAPSGPSIFLSPSTLPGGYTSSSYSQTITASGGTSPYTFSVISGSLPNGLSLSSSGVLSGTPNVASTYNFTIRAQDAQGYTGSQAYSVTISTPPTITISPISLSNGTVNSAYSQTISASGAQAPYGFYVTSGSLPNGLSLSSNGSLTGTPSTTGTSNFTVTAYSNDGFSASKSYSITINTATVYNEQIGPTSVCANTLFDIVITGGVPNTTFSYTGAATGSQTLNSSGGFTFPNQTLSAGTFDYYINFNGSGNQKTYTVTSTTPQPYGTFLSDYCSGTTLWGVYANGACGTYTSVIEYNSTSCGGGGGIEQ